MPLEEGRAGPDNEQVWNLLVFGLLFWGGAIALVIFKGKAFLFESILIALAGTIVVTLQYWRAHAIVHFSDQGVILEGPGVGVRRIRWNQVDRIDIHSASEQKWGEDSEASSPQKRMQMVLHISDVSLPFFFHKKIIVHERMPGGHNALEWGRWARVHQGIGSNTASYKG
jgi:hypothetical protein